MFIADQRTTDRTLISQKVLQNHRPITMYENSNAGLKAIDSNSSKPVPQNKKRERILSANPKNALNSDLNSTEALTNLGEGLKVGKPKRRLRP